MLRMFFKATHREYRKNFDRYQVDNYAFIIVAVHHRFPEQKSSGNPSQTLIQIAAPISPAGNMCEATADWSIDI
jgi:hypothetical protein